jgi:erythromycin esterase
VVNLGRVSDDTGDIFVAKVDARGDAAACLPVGLYWAQVDGASTSLGVPVTVPTSGTIDFTVYSRAQVEQIPGDLRVEHADLKSFVDSIRQRLVIGLGEANHGTGEFYTYRGRLSLALARAGNLRSILLEADAINMLAVEDYVMGGDVPLEASVAALRFWITDIREFLTFLVEVRAYNASVSPADKLHVLGMDAQRLEPPVQLLLALKSELGISDRETELLARIAPDHGKAFRNMSSEERAVVSSLLDRIATPPATPDLRAGRTRASIAARSAQYQLGYLGGTGPAGQRDQAMAELAAFTIELNGSRQAAVWAHNGHLAREPAFVDKSTGQHLADKFGEMYYPVAFLSYQGTARAWDGGGKIGVIPHDLAPALPYNLESAVMRATSFVDVAWVNLDAVNVAFKQWLSIPRYVREFGAAYHPKHTQILRAFPAAFSAIVVIQHASGSTPTPTGVRKVAR